MAFLGEARCPGCRAGVPLGSFWMRAPKDRGGIFLIGNVGVVCPACDAKLRVLQHRLAIVAFGSFAALCAAFAALGNIEHIKFGSATQGLNLLLIATAIVGWMVLFRRYGYRFVHFRPIQDGEKVRLVPLSKPIVPERMPEARTTQESVDVKPALQAEKLPSGTATPPKPTWMCPECGEENPGRFDICCICDTRRDDIASPHPAPGRPE